MDANGNQDCTAVTAPLLDAYRAGMQKQPAQQQQPQPSNNGSGFDGITKFFGTKLGTTPITYGYITAAFGGLALLATMGGRRR
jgi:hypothetical protein